MNFNLEQNNYLYIPNFISHERARELAKSFIQFANENNLSGDNQIPESQSYYNFNDFLELLCEKTPEVSKFLGETVLPTYSYARVYQKDAILERHRDRAACEVSLTINLSKDNEWPIYIQKPNGEEVELNLNSGDAMMYMGCTADHWRHKFEGNQYVQVFLHYVKSKGENAWAVFDKVREKPENFVSVNCYENSRTTLEKTTEKTTTKKVYKKNIEDYIVEFDNILSPELCDEILNEYVNSGLWTPTGVGNGSVNRSIRNVDSIQLTDTYIIDKNYDVRKRLDNLIFKGAGEAIKKYNELFPEAMIVEDSGYELLRYNPGFFYKQHTDSFKQKPRAVSCSFALNDDYEGGEFAFFDDEFRWRINKGSVIMFPSNFMYPHQILPVTKGTRYSIITWFI